MYNFNGKKVLVYGNGISAQGAVYALSKSGASVVCHSDEFGKPFPGGDYDLIVISPGIAKSHFIHEYALKSNIALIGEIELGSMLTDKPIIAVTGTNGKTTTVKMIEAMLKTQYRTALCGNIGVPFSKMALDKSYDLFVIEVSSFQLESIRHFKPHVAVITNISEDHLDRHKDMDEYAAAKKRIAENQDENDYTVLSQDSIHIKYLTDFAPRSKTVFTCTRGSINGICVSNGVVYCYGEKIVGVECLPFSEEHNIANFLNAVAVAKKLGISNQNIIAAAKKFRSDSHRIEFVREHNGVRFYDDSKGTNVAATVNALNSMSGSVCLIAGGSDKKCNFDALFEFCVGRVNKINLIGSTKDRMKLSAYKSGYSNVECFCSLEDAVISAYKSGCRNVLLSPATASFDMFKNYAERGERFVRAVHALE